MKSLRVLLILSIVTAWSGTAFAQAAPEQPASDSGAGAAESTPSGAAPETTEEATAEVVETAEAVPVGAAPETAETVEEVAEETTETDAADEEVPTGAAPESADEKGTKLVEKEELLGSESDYVLLDQVDTSTRLVFGSFFADRPISEVTRKQIVRKQADSITDALTDQPGVFVQSTNPGAGSVIIRGAVGPENMYVFDGIRYNQSTYRTGPNQYLNLVDPMALSSIRVLRGPAGVIYGGGSIGGAVFMTPEYLERAPLYRLSVGFKSADYSYHLAGETTLSTENKRYYLQIGASAGIHHDLRVGSNYGGELELFPGPEIANLDTDTNRVATTGFNTFHWRARGQGQVTDKVKLRLDYFGSATTDAPRTDQVGRGDIRFYDNLENLIYGTMEYDGEGVFDKIRWNISYHRADEDIERIKCSTVTQDGVKVSPKPLFCARYQDLDPKDRKVVVKSRQYNSDVTNTVGTSLYWLTSIPEISLSLQYGLDGYLDYVTSSAQKGDGLDGELEKKERGNFLNGSTYGIGGIFLTADWDAYTTGNHVLNVQLGGRGEGVFSHAKGISRQIKDLTYYSFGGVGSASFNYFYSDLAHAYITWAQGFRPPNLQESTVLGDAGSFFDVPNKDLRAERSDTLELGGKVFFPDIIRVNANLFVSLMTNRITEEKNSTYEGKKTIDGKPVRKRINADTAYYYGAELDFETASFYYTSLFGNVTWYDGAVSTDKEDTENWNPGLLHGALGALGGAEFYTNPRRLPPLHWTAGVTVSTDPSWYVTLWTEGALAQDKLANGDRKDLRICEAKPGITYRDLKQPCPGSPMWATLNVRGGWENENFFVNAALENILDTKYRPHGSGYAAPGINFMANVGFRGF